MSLRFCFCLFVWFFSFKGRTLASMKRIEVSNPSAPKNLQNERKRRHCFRGQNIYGNTLPGSFCCETSIAVHYLRHYLVSYTAALELELLALDAEEF